MDSADLEVLRKIVAWTGKAQHAALVTVARTSGSSPRPVGSLLLVRGDGRLAGSVSGGYVEDDLVARLRAHAPDRPRVEIYGATPEEAERYRLPCGTMLELVVEPIGDLALWRQLLAAVQQRRGVARCLDLASGEACIVPAEPGQDFFFDGSRMVSVHGPRWRLLLIGATQISRYLAQMAKALDYQVIVCDPRVEYLDSWDVRGVELRGSMPDDTVRELPADERTAVVALTHDPRLDDMALMEALDSPAFYVGAAGSAANSIRRRERLAALGLAPESIARLHAPCGLPIGSRTPPEIAVSVLAQITAVRHGLPRLAGAAVKAVPACA